MVLTLEVIGEQAENLGAAGRKVFDGIGGTIGRLADNDWVFRDPYVSGRHALIRYVNGKYFIEDTSTNGVFINSPDKRLSRTESQQLRDGDLIYIDAYQIRVSIEAGASATRNDPLAHLRRDVTQVLRKGNKPAAQDEDRTASLVMSDAKVDEDEGTQWFGLSEMSQEPKAPASPPPPPTPRQQPQQATEALKPPARRAPPAPDRARQPAARSPSLTKDAASHFEALLAAAGIEGLESSREAAQTLGEVLRIAVGGVMEVLRARERMKDDLRMRGTTFKATDNNPLKFSANVDDAFHNLLVKHNTAYLEPAAALDDALRDVRDHQSATLAAMRLAFESMLSQFDPERLQEDFDRQMRKGSILGAPAKLRYWELYRDRYGELVKNADAGFRTLFADEFAKAYEEQIDRLRSQRTEK